MKSDKLRTENDTTAGGGHNSTRPVPVTRLFLARQLNFDGTRLAMRLSTSFYTAKGGKRDTVFLVDRSPYVVAAVAHAQTKWCDVVFDGVAKSSEVIRY